MRAGWLVALAALSALGALALERAQERLLRAPQALALAELSAELAELRAELAEGRAELARLEDEVAQRERDVAAVRASLGRGAPSAPSGVEEPRPDGVVGGLPGAELPSDAPSFDPDRLAEAGLPERDAAELRELFEATELERLDLRDRAERERWPAERRDSALALVDERLVAVRRDRGEDTWDWLLYSTGRPNRVVVQGVLARSAAAAAGLQPGDVILAYADARLFEPDELVQATQAGALGEHIELEVERNGARARVTVPRGPLGVKVAGLTVRPSEAVAR